MKKLVLVLIVAFLPTTIFSAPFGLKMGMTIEEIAEQCENEPKYVEDGIYMVTPIKKHPVFEYYAVYVSEKTGLYEIRALSSPISTNKYGAELQNSFHNVKDRIAKTYGKPKINTWVDSSISDYYKNDEYWFYTLKEGSRKLFAVWGADTTLADDLYGVWLECSAISGVYNGTGQLVLYYSFNNAASVEDEQDEVF